MKHKFKQVDLMSFCIDCGKRVTLVDFVCADPDPSTEECPGAKKAEPIQTQKVCTCGAHKVGSPKHSSWC